MPLGRRACGSPHMLLAATLQLALFGSLAAAQRVRVCGTPEMSFSAAQQIQKELNATMEAMVGTTNQTLAGERLAAMPTGVETANARTAADTSAKPATGISVKIHFHVVRSSSTGKDASDAQIAKQIEVINTNYAQTGATFTLASTDRTVNAAWSTARQNSAEWTAMTNALHKGTVQELNLYAMNLPYPLLGWSQFPWWYAASPKQDGVFFDMGTLPGGSTPSFNLGMTATHEVGHWFGLFHPFQGGCTDSKNDWVSDTASQAQPEYGCVSTPRDTCPSQAGTDVYRNILDYPPDACMDTLTTGQATRIAVSWNAYRVPGARAYAPGGAPVPSTVAGPTVTAPAPTKKAPTRAPVPTKKRPTTERTLAPTKPKPTAKRTLPKACGGKCGKVKPTPKPTVKRTLPKACGGKCGKPKPTRRTLPKACGGKCATVKPKTGRRLLK